MKLLDRFVLHGTVKRSETVAGRMRGITIETPPLSWQPGQHIQIFVDNRLLGPRRTYSIWDQTDDTIELRIHEHDPNTPGVRWTRTIQPGQPVQFTRPEGTLVTRPASYHLFAGDETAAAAFGAMIRALPPQTPIHGVLEVDTPADQLPINALTWTHRNGAPAADSATLVESIRELDLPQEPGIAYLAGEARTIQAIRRHLTQGRDWPRRSIITKPFWTPGKKGMD